MEVEQSEQVNVMSWLVYDAAKSSKVSKDDKHSRELDRWDFRSEF